MTEPCQAELLELERYSGEVLRVVIKKPGPVVVD